MRVKLLVLLASIALSSCAVFKELQPQPSIDPAEDGFLSVYDGDKLFLLHKDGKHYIRFPAPRDDKFYLVLKVPPKSVLPSSLAREFDARRGALETIPDENEANDTLSVYPIDNWSRSYYWVISDVREELPLMLRYRYVPRWRYTFETKRIEYRDSLARVRMDRTTYNRIGPAADVDAIDLRGERRTVDLHSARAGALRRELSRLRDLFPPDIAAKKDSAYLQYVALSDDLDQEITFLETFGAVLDIFQKERDVRGKPEEFLAAIPAFSEFMRQKERFSEPVRNKAGQLLLTQLAGLGRHYRDLLFQKKDLGPVNSLDPAIALYQDCGTPPDADLDQMARFVDRFNIEVTSLAQFESEAAKVEAEFRKDNRQPSEQHYRGLVTLAEAATRLVPQSLARNMGTYGTVYCAGLLDQEIKKARARGTGMQGLYGSAADVSARIEEGNWRAAENGLMNIHQRTEWAAYPVLASQKDTILRLSEKEIFARVREQVRLRAQRFIAAHESDIENIPRLYEDSSFVPSYLFRFSASGPNEVARKRSIVRDEMARLRDVAFPEAAIKSIYREFQKDVGNSMGVQRARAIVDHGRMYKGDDRQVKGLVAECDANVAKSIVRPKEYRKLYALPVRSSGGRHEYVFKLLVNIPSQAQFPVYDINIKLPEEVASKAGTERWYKSITLNNKPVKNEGRFRISSPTASSNYESLISPVQMDKKRRNILEVRFLYPSARVFEVSAMAQVPIIRKN